jgi:uncharacterized membrane protein YvlD (DUF360 family)
MEVETNAVANALAKIGVTNATVAAVGLIGALISPLVFHGMTRPQMVASVVLGFFSSVYGTPLVIYYAGLEGESEKFSYGVAFFVGLFAMAVIPWVKARLKAKAEAVP